MATPEEKVNNVMSGTNFTKEIVVGDFEFLVHYPSVEEEIRISLKQEALTEGATLKSPESKLMPYAWALLDVVVDRVCKIEADATKPKRIIMLSDLSRTNLLPKSFRAKFAGIRSKSFYPTIFFPLYEEVMKFIDDASIAPDELKNL